MGLLSDTLRSPIAWGTSVVLVCAAASFWHRHRQPVPLGAVERQGAIPDGAKQSFARADDLILRARRGPALVIGQGENESTQRPLRGALVDVRYEYRDVVPQDLFLWWMPGFVDAEGAYHLPRAESVAVHECSSGTGVRVIAREGDARLTTDYCVVDQERFVILTDAENLPPGAFLADELAAGVSDTVVDERGELFDDPVPSDYLVVQSTQAAEGGVALFESKGAHIEQHKIRIGVEEFPAPIHVRHPSAHHAERNVLVLRGDLFDALAAQRSVARRKVSVVAPELEGRGSLEVIDEAGAVLASGQLRGAARVLDLPRNLGHRLRVRDHHGVIQGTSKPLADTGWTDLEISHTTRGVVQFALTDENDAPLAAHVLFRGLNGTANPQIFRSSQVYGAGRSVYLPHGSGEVHLPPGDYQLTASHGPTHDLLQRTITVETDNEVEVREILARAYDTSDWVAGDFHLHAQPSPDSKVSLDERVVSLACAGIDFAVPTDHNRVTDYAPDIDQLDLRQLASFPGVEVTTSGPRYWGHFNAYPLSVPSGSQERAVPPYFDTTPTAIFDGARQRGAKVLQVNHARMPPRIGYFDIAEFDANTGHAKSKDFSDKFDALEAFNGIWIQEIERIREGAHDLVGLARRGRMITATGNSDSHQLLFQEAGWPRTWVHTAREPRETRGDRVLGALAARHTQVSSGPLLELTVDDREPGDVLTSSDGKVRVTLKVWAAAWVPLATVELWADDRAVRAFPVPPPKKNARPSQPGLRFETRFELPIERDVVLLAYAEGGQPLPDVLPYDHAQAVAFTSLVYVDADGDGKVTIGPREP